MKALWLLQKPVLNIPLARFLVPNWNQLGKTHPSACRTAGVDHRMVHGLDISRPTSAVGGPTQRTEKTQVSELPSPA